MPNKQCPGFRQIPYMKSDTVYNKITSTEARACIWKHDRYRNWYYSNIISTTTECQNVAHAQMIAYNEFIPTEEKLNLRLISYWDIVLRYRDAAEGLNNNLTSDSFLVIVWCLSPFQTQLINNKANGMTIITAVIKLPFKMIRANHWIIVCCHHNSASCHLRLWRH